MDRAFAVAAACLFTLGLALRLYQIGEFEFWLDEALTGYLAVAEDWLHFVHNSPPLYFLLLRGWSGVFGVEEASMRGFSALAGAALIPLAMYAGRTIVDNGTGIAAGLVVLASPIGIYYAQEARPYALLLAELMLVYWLLWRPATDTAWKTVAPLALATAAAVYTHSLSVIPLALAYLLAMARALIGRRPGDARLYFAAGATAVCLYLPWLFWWVDRTSFDPSDMTWLQSIWNAYPLWRLPADSLLSFYHAATLGGGSVVAKQYLEQPTLAGMPLLGAVVLAAGAGLLIHGILRETRKRVDLLFMSCLVLGPLLVLAGISFFKPVYLPGRYDLIAYPAFVLLAGYVLSRLYRLSTMRDGKPVLCALLLVAAIPPAVRTFQFYDADSAPESAPVASFLAGNAAAGDLVLMVERTGIRTVYYLQLLGYEWRDRKCSNRFERREFSCRFLPISLETAPAAVARHGQAREDRSLSRDVARIIDDHSYANVFLVLKRMDNDGNRIVLNASISPVVAMLEELGYDLQTVKTDLKLLQFRRG